MALPKIVVQILVYNEPDQVIDNLMASLEKVIYPKERWSIVILNNPHPDHNLYSYLQRVWLSKSETTLPKLILKQATENLFFSGGHQWAWANLSQLESPDYLYLLNGDTKVTPNFLNALADFISQTPQAVLMQSRIMLEQNPEQINSVGNAMHFLGFGFSKGYKRNFVDYQLELDPIPSFYPSGAGFLIKTTLIDQIGGLFDPRFLIYHDDLDLGWRTRLLGYNVDIVNDSIIFHQYEFAKSIRQFYLMERNRHITNLGNYQLPTLLLIAPAYLVMELGTLAFAVKSGWWKEKIKSWTYLFSLDTWRWVLKRRRFIKSIRKVSDSELLKLTTGSLTNQEVSNFLLDKIVNPLMEVYLKLIKFILNLI